MFPVFSYLDYEQMFKVAIFTLGVLEECTYFFETVIVVVAFWVFFRVKGECEGDLKGVALGVVEEDPAGAGK
jgi:hypothetical protein